MPLTYSFYLSLSAFGLGGIFSLLFCRWKAVARAASLFWGVLGSGLLIYLSWQLFNAGISLDFQLFQGIATITTALHIDIFTAFFLLLIGVVGLGFFSFWSIANRDDTPSVQSLAHAGFLIVSLLVASSNVLFFCFLMQLFGLVGWFYLLMDKESGLQQKLITKYIALFEISVMALTIMWLLLASSAQNLYFGALVQTVTYLEDTVTWMVTGLLLVGMMTLAISPQQLVRATSSYLAGMFSTLMFILVGYLFLRVELFFVPAVSLWLNIAMVIFGLGMLLFFSIFAWLKKSMITYWSLALPMLLSIGGLFFWALQGNIAAMVSIWGVALYWALIAGVFNGALYFWVRPYRGLNQLRLVVLAISLFTTLWFAFQGLWQSIVLVSDPVWKIVMLSTLILAIAIGSFYAMVAGMRSLPEGEEILFWNQITHWPLLVWTLAITVLMVGSGMVTELLAQYTRTFLGLNGTLVQGTWTSFSVSIQGITNTMYVPFVVILVVLFWLVVSLLVGGKTKKSTAANL